MGLIDSINRLNNENISARQRKELEKQVKKEIENELYNYFVDYFNDSINNTQTTYKKLLKLKEKNLKNENFDSLSDYEKNNIYDKILQKVYKHYKTIEHQTSAEIKKQLYNSLYNKIENYYTNYGACAFNMLQDYTLKNKIIDNISIIYETNDENIIYLKKEYQKINKLLYNEFSNYETIEEIEDTKKIKINWLYLLHVIFKILIFPVLLTIGCAFTYKPNNKRK